MHRLGLQILFEIHLDSKTATSFLLITRKYIYKETTKPQNHKTTNYLSLCVFECNISPIERMKWHFAE